MALPEAAGWATVALDVLNTAYPYGAGHTSRHSDDNDVTPAVLHPAFHGALDWHSSAHMQWSLVRLLTLAPAELAQAGLTERVCALLDDRLNPAALDTEIHYLREHPGYERPYGWAWAAMLAAATTSCPLPRAVGWADACSGLATLVADALPRFLTTLSHPVRHGVHANTAFAMILGLEAFGVLGRADVVDAVAERAVTWFGNDSAADTRFEPSGTDFLSPVLCEAELMRRVLSPSKFRNWFAAYLPDLGADSVAGRSHAHLLEIPTVNDQTDGQLAHLHGLALSRSWLLTSLAATVAPGSPDRGRLTTAARAQYAATAPVVVAGNFMATHWLVSFALLAGAGEQGR